MAVSPIDNDSVNLESDYNSIHTLYFNLDEYEDIIDEIAESEEAFLDTDKHHMQYYLGSAIYFPEYTSIQLDTVISPATLFSYSLSYIRLYLAEYSICNITRDLPYIHILQLDIKPDGEYCVIIKTFWLKIVQRAWKKQFAKRRTVILSRGHIAARRHFELTGTYPRELRNIPGLRGLLV
jgi:hypothetical protein